MRRQSLLVAVAAMAVVALGSLGSPSQAATPEVSYDESLQSTVSSESTSSKEEQVSTEPTQNSFCNTTGYLHCQPSDGTACYSPGTSVRCIVEPTNYCEWGFCRCESTGTWTCIY